MIKRVLTVIIAVGALLAVSTPAQSQQYPPVNNGIIISDSTVVAGQFIMTQAFTFAPGSTVTFNFFSQPVTLGTATADASGVATLEAQIPTTATPGQHTITASGTGSTCAPVELSTGITVLSEEGAGAGAGAGAGGGAAGVGAGAAGTGAGAAGGLPRTGNDALPLARIAGALVAVGGGLLFITRRRRAAAAA